MVELRKRKTAPAAPEQPAKKKTGPKPKASGGAKAKEVVDEKIEQPVENVKDDVVAAAVESNGATGDPKPGDVIKLEGFGGEVETHDGKKTTLKQLVEQSKSGVVIFTYPKASTPGCTKQACSFRDGHSFLTSSGLSIYGLSSDTPKANATFKSKYKLPYPLLCDSKYTLIGAIGLQQPVKKTKRGVFIIDKSGKVLELFKGGPEPTVDAAKKIVDGMVNLGDTLEESAAEEKEVADTADEVADTAAELDG